MKVTKEASLKQLQELRNMKEGWGFGCEKPFDKALLDNVEFIIENLEHTPAVYPTYTSDVQLEWYKGEEYLEILVTLDGQCELYKTDGKKLKADRYEVFKYNSTLILDYVKQFYASKL